MACSKYKKPVRVEHTLAGALNNVTDTNGLAVPETLLDALAVALIGSVSQVRHGGDWCVSWRGFRMTML